MAATFQYSSDAIDSIALRSAGLSLDDDCSSSESPSASEKLTQGLEEAMSMISYMISSSAGVMEKFKVRNIKHFTSCCCLLTFLMNMIFLLILLQSTILTCCFALPPLVSACSERMGRFVDLLSTRHWYHR